jgi:hypothetical protein
MGYKLRVIDLTEEDILAISFTGCVCGLRSDSVIMLPSERRIDVWNLAELMAELDEMAAF